MLNNREGRRGAVIVNEKPEVNIDADLVRAQTELSRTDGILVEMSNGCICYTLRDDFLAEVRRLAGEGRHLALEDGHDPFGRSPRLRRRPRSARDAYVQALARTKDVALALEELDRRQQRLVSRDARQVWGRTHPAAADPAG